jgi:ABC-type uncharacterized transport system auxiliary subunit
MKLSRIAATVAVAAIVSGCGVTHHGATAVTHTAPHAVAASTATSHLLAAEPAATPAMKWLGSVGGQAQVTFNDKVDILAAAWKSRTTHPPSLTT